MACWEHWHTVTAALRESEIRLRTHHRERAGMLKIVDAQGSCTDGIPPA